MCRKIDNFELSPGEDSFDLNLSVSVDGEDLKTVKSVYGSMEREVIHLILKSILEDLEEKEG